MHYTALPAALLALCLASSAARISHSLPEDPHAFPKYRLSFLNGLPVLNETAERWLKDGLRGGELEFLEQPWKEGDWQQPPSFKEIEGGGMSPDASASHQQQTLDADARGEFKLERMKLGPRVSYLCLIPPPLKSPPTPPEEPTDDLTPVHSWSLLQPLSGTCLYHRQGWFTYSYCHNQEIRQFKELPVTHFQPGGYQPEEDTDWESYTLGRAPPTPEPGADLTVAEQTAQAANLELARGAGSRYLVQRWGDGTLCDKTMRPREVEVQFHCSMTMTDTILFVKEAKTCSYVLVIHTPRLCAEPGFKSRQDAREEAPIRCREIVGAHDSTLAGLPESDRPVKPPWRRPKSVLPAADPRDQPKPQQVAGGGDMNALRRALEKLLGKKPGASTEGTQVIVERLNDDGDVVVEFVDEIPIELEGGDEEGGGAGQQSIFDALVAAGYEVKGEKGKPDINTQGDKKGQQDQKRKKDPKQTPDSDHPGREEL